MSTVYVVNFAGHDHREAEKYGDLKIITTGYISLGSLDRVLFEVVNAVKDSEETDWLLPSGLLIINVIASAVWLRKHDKIQMLIWDRKEGGYREMKYSGPHVDYLIKGISDSDDRHSDEGHQDTA